MESRNGSFESIFYHGGNMKQLLKRFFAWLQSAKQVPEPVVSVDIPADEIAKARRQEMPCLMFDLTPVED